MFDKSDFEKNKNDAITLSQNGITNGFIVTIFLSFKSGETIHLFLNNESASIAIKLLLISFLTKYKLINLLEAYIVFIFLLLLSRFS